MRRNTVWIALSLLLAAPMGIALAEEPIAEKLWEGSVSLGFTQTSGNTDKLSLNTGGQLTRKFIQATLVGKFDLFLSRSDGNLDDQKWALLLRNVYDFNEEDGWFFSQQLLTDHDRFADIDVRFTPSLTLGRWFSKTDDWKFSAEAGFGYETTDYRSSRSSDSTSTGVGRLFADKALFENSRLTEEFSVFPSLEGDGYRARSVTEFTNQIYKGWDLMVKYVLDYDDEPSPGNSKTDKRLVVGVKKSF